MSTGIIMIDLLKLKELVESEIDKTFDNYVCEKNIRDAMIYSVKNGGKRVRPILMLLSASVYGEITQTVLDLAVGLELIHSYSLVHDDLPCMDDDDLRRGKPTAHIKFGENIAVIAGDGLLNLAFEKMLSGNVDANKIKAIKYIVSKTGAKGMVGGQSLDINTAFNPHNIDELNSIYEGKTSALLQAALVGGCLCNGGEKDMELLDNFGKDIGLVFQYIDDILDVTSSEEELGKEINQDERNGKNTAVTLLGLDGAKALAEKKTVDALNSLKSLGDKTKALSEYCESLLERNK